MKRYDEETEGDVGRKSEHNTEPTALDHILTALDGIFGSGGSASQKGAKKGAGSSRGGRSGSSGCNCSGRRSSVRRVR